MRNTGLDEVQAGIKVAWININNLRYSNDTILMAESKEELKSVLMKVKEESEKAVLKLSVKKSKIMASCPITSWQMDGETVETVADFIFESEVAQLCPTLCDPVDCSPLGSSVHGILPARILEWVAISFSRASSQPRN